MAKPKMKSKPEAYIETRAGVRGGAPVIAGTGIKVLDVAVRYEVMGMTPEEIEAKFRSASARILTKKQQTRMIDRIWSLEKLRDIGELMRLGRVT